MDACAGGILTIDVGAIAANWRRLSARAPSSECAAVVKANAYGTGIETTVPALAAAGCKTFFVALPHEGERVRRIAPNATIYVLSGLMPGIGAFPRRSIGCVPSWDQPKRFPNGPPSWAHITSTGTPPFMSIRA